MKEREEQKEAEQIKKKPDRVRMILKVFLYIILVFFVLNSILYVVLSIPFVQNKLVSFASKELGSMLNTKVEISEVRFNLFSKVSVKDLYIEDQQSDTLAYAHQVDVHIQSIFLLFKNELRLNNVSLDDLYINITAPDSLSDYNFQFIINEFSSSDSTKVDTTSSTMAVIIDDINISNGRLAHRIKSAERTPESFNSDDIYVTELNANVSIHSIDMDALDIHVNSISAKEKSGLEISKLEGHITSKGSHIELTDLLLTTPNSHLSTQSLFYDLETEEFELITDKAEISPNDFIAFMPSLKFLDDKFILKAKIKGKLPEIDAEEILLTYGNDAKLEGNAFLASYADLSNTDFGVNIKELYISPKGIEKLAKLGVEDFEMPPVMDSLGAITLDASLKGKLSKFSLDSKASMRTGVLTLVADGNIDTTFTNFDVNAKLNTTNFKIGSLAGKESGLDKLSMHANIEAHQKGEGTLSAKVKGRIDTMDMMHGAVKDLPFAAYYNPQKIGFGADAKLHFGRFMVGFEMTTTEKPDISFAMRIKDFDIAHFYKTQYWNKPSIDFDVKGKIKQFDIDNLNADITIKDLKFIDDDFSYTPSPIEFKAWQDTASGVKHINLKSDILTAKVEGDYKFSTLADEFSKLMHKYLSNVFPDGLEQVKYANNFTFKAKLFNSEELGYIFDLPMDIIEPLEIEGTINTVEQIIKIGGKLPLAQNYSTKIKDVNLNIANIDSAFHIKLSSNIENSLGGYKFSLDADGADNEVASTLALTSDTTGVEVSGEVKLNGKFTLDENKKLISLLEVLPTNIKSGQFFLNILPAEIRNTSETTEVKNLGLGINGRQILDINGHISENKNDSLHISFTKAQVADILEGLNISDIYAEVDGDILIVNALKAPELYMDDFKIKNITLYKDTIGTINADTQWSQELGGINLVATLNKKEKEIVLLEGMINPEKNAIDIHADIDRFSLSWVKPFVEGLISDISGDISSHFTIKGTMDEPITEGFLGFNNLKIRVDYTNVAYYLSDTINITPDRVGFDNLILKDNEGNQGTVSAKLTHKGWKNIQYDLNMRAQNLMVLNTQSRTDSLFYGKLFASGNIKITGNQKGIDLDMQLRNGKKSNLNITIPQVSEATEYKSVVYINVPKKEKDVKEDTRWRIEKQQTIDDEIPIRLKMKLDVDPELNLAVVIDPQTGDRMTIKGRGSINFNYDLMTQNMSVFGDYHATDGGVRLNLQNISTLEFKIKEGSKLNFIGDPFKTKFDITAFRRVRADLRTLDLSFEQDNTSPRVQVDCLLGISGDIRKMNLTYDIELVGAGDDQVRKVKSLVNTDEIRIKQFAYLITSGTFYSNTGSSGAGFTDGMWTSLASTALSSGLNAVLGNMLGENWELGADITDSDQSLSASTNLLDNKLKIRANVGHRTNSTSSASESSLIGDFDVEYMLNSIWTLKAYSHTNDKFYRQAPTTQGVGLVYTREGSTFKRMFKSIGKRRGAWARLERDSLRATKRVEDSLKIIKDSLIIKENNKGHKVSDKGKEMQPVVYINTKDKTYPDKESINNYDIAKQPARKEEEENKNTSVKN